MEIAGGGDITIAARQWRQFTTRNIRAGAERGARQYLRIRYEDLKSYMDREKQARQEVLKEMAAEAQRLGLYE